MAQSTLRVFPRAGRPRCLYKVRAFGAVAHFHSSSLPFFPQPALLPCVRAGVVYGRVSCAVLSLSMASLHVTRVSTAVWKWFCRCPDIIGLVYDTSSDEEFFTPPTSPSPSSEQERVAVTTAPPPTYPRRMECRTCFHHRKRFDFGGDMLQLFANSHPRPRL